MNEQNPLMESGTILYLKEHTEQLKIQNDIRRTGQLIIIWTLLALFLSAAFLFWYIRRWNVLGHIIANCMG